MTPNYPRVMSEWDTMEAAVNGCSLARFGDGELRLCHEGKHIAQVSSPELSKELRTILAYASDYVNCLPCIPNANAPNGKPEMWGPTRYSAPEYVSYYKAGMYGSSFVTRPDSAPWIDTDEYWNMTCKLWNQKDVILVIGTRGGSITHLDNANSVEIIYGPERDAYAEVDKLQEQITNRWQLWKRRVILCLGPAATILAWRLAKQGMHAVDVGHLGRFMPQRFLQRSV